MGWAANTIFFSSDLLKAEGEGPHDSTETVRLEAGIILTHPPTSLFPFSPASFTPFLLYQLSIHLKDLS